MKTKRIISSLVISLGTLCVTSAEIGDPAKLISLKKCAMCHKKADKGDQYGRWQTMGHAKAYEILGTEEAKAVAAKLGIDDPQSSGACLKCHSTAYFFTETRQSEEVTLEEGVSCQSCHGAGADYKKKTIMEDRKASIAAGMVYPAKEKSCTLCHNDTGPTWNPKRYTLPDGTTSGFDLTQAYEKIKHERPTQ